MPRWNGLPAISSDRNGRLACVVQKCLELRFESATILKFDDMAMEPKATILVVDDDAPFRSTVASVLSRKGYSVALAEDGRQGVELAAAHRPDLVVCDLEMPVMDGYQVLQALRSHPVLGEVPVIFLTGRDTPEQIRSGMNLGADDYLTKPLNAEDLLNAIRARLTRRVAARQRSREQMQKAADLFARAVHDLRDPLFVVLGYTDLLKNRDQPSVPGDILGRMRDATLRMQAILSETMLIAKSRMHRLEYEPVCTELGHVCEMLTAGLEECARVQFERPPAPVMACVDVTRFRQAVEQLLVNALKFSSGPVELRLFKQGESAILQVQDVGIGIPDGELERVGEPFFRASNAGMVSGNGLGLSIARACVEQHGGVLRFTTRLGQGSVFSIILPAALRPQGPGAAVPASNRAAAESRAATSSQAGALRVAIIDDEPLVREVVRELLAEATAEVVAEAASLAEARLLLRSSAPDVVLLDVGLPDGPGFDLLPELGPSVSVVFLSNAEEHAVNAFDCDAVDFLLKPITRERLCRALERVRERRAVASKRSGGAGLESTFLVKTLSEKRLVKVGEIRHIAAYGEYSWVYWDSGKGAMLRKPLRQWARELPSSQFLRVHRGAIVNLAFLETVERLPGGKMQVRLRDVAKGIPVSLRLAATVNRKLKAFSGA